MLCVLWMPVNTSAGNDGQPPWFEHDQMTVAEKSCCDVPGLTGRERGPSFASAGHDGSGLYGEGEKVVLCDV
ncbi:putative zinc ribbon protein [Escherichia coli]|uniref:putative zinc ribbon protein n=1 Tax=Escherichia coli TaxID=562 RepID=UPI003D9C5AB1